MSYRNQIDEWRRQYFVGAAGVILQQMGYKIDAEIAELKSENERMSSQLETLADLHAKALAHTPRSYHQPIIEILKKKARAK